MPLTSCAQPSLEFVFVVSRHGQRTPASECTNLRKSWPEGFGTLNTTGCTQTFRLGQYIRRRYVPILGADHQSFSDELVKATHNTYPRCHQSIRYTLQGLLEPHRKDVPPCCPKQPEAVFEIGRDPKDTNDIFLQGIAQNFPRLCSLPSPLDERESMESFLRDICIRIGSEKIDQRAMCQALDTLITFRHNNDWIAPEWAEAIWNDVVDTNRIIFPGVMEGQEWHFSYTLVEKMLEDLKQLGQTKHKMHLFSMSDLNLFSLMRLINPDFPFHVPFATTIFFEIFRDTKDKLLIQVLYFPDHSKKPYMVPLGALSNPCLVEDFIEELERIRDDKP